MFWALDIEVRELRWTKRWFRDLESRQVRAEAPRVAAPLVCDNSFPVLTTLALYSLQSRQSLTR